MTILITSQVHGYWSILIIDQILRAQNFELEEGVIRFIQFQLIETQMKGSLPQKYCSSISDEPDQHQNNIQTVSIKELKKINPSDTFPCYNCFDQPLQRIMCQICDHKGFIMGDHPMVKFVDDFLNQNLMNQLKITTNQNKDSCVNDSNSSDQQFLQKKVTKCSSALASYQIRDSQSSTNEPPLNMMQSLKNQNNLGVHYGYKCDMCDMEPLKGIRYHCLKCQDFDLCNQCYNKKEHGHAFEKIEKKQYFNQKKIIESIRRTNNFPQSKYK